MKRFLRDNGLSLGFGLMFLAALVGQAFAGQSDFNHRQLAQGGRELSLLQYVTSSDFAVNVAENWQSEYLQFFLYVFATVWLVQRGSPESKPVDEVGLESDEEQRVGRHTTEESPEWAKAGGWRTGVFSRSLGIVMAVIFLLSWFAQSVSGLSVYNAEQIAELQDPVTWGGYVVSGEFWNRTLQNWQSELLAVGSLAVLSVYLRQRGSPESKPVGTSHETTETSG
ncbi:DUF6766 family protein [Glycomyces algeriensis]|uniref:Uncharacterized protein n=1 Tax=Glycomyces algeriensis TaxID=256037 RepID=A0A9W6G4I6_9ACTN|nr:DUF6766 family protein [Glycomyces algeriensis]MDA1368028.1 hypothetical protein [Glycomyces algeriensis]MDR7352537.1 hypothetical protein [Glycomyces algeriensis]GLI40218.1 hypothetical protein GALLR39Z86_00680 [Glycomyces algeriensis]